MPRVGRRALSVLAFQRERSAAGGLRPCVWLRRRVRQFLPGHLAALVDVSRTPWRWREGAAGIGGSAALLKQFQQAQRIREVYFKPGTQMPEARFNLTPDTLDAAATRFTLDLDGQRLEYRHGPLESKAMVWPGPGGIGQAVIAF